MKGDRRLWVASTSGIIINGLQNALQASVIFDLLMPLATSYVFCAKPNGAIGAVFEEPIVRPVDKTPPEG